MTSCNWLSNGFVWCVGLEGWTEGFEMIGIGYWVVVRRLDGGLGEPRYAKGRSGWCHLDGLVGGEGR